MGIDLKKEIKVSELFKRREKAPKERKPDAGGGRKPGKAGAPAPESPLMRAFNLMPRDDAREKGPRSAAPQIAVALAAVLLFGALGSLFIFSSATVSEKRARYDELRVQVAALEVPAKEQQAPELLDERRARTAALASALAARVAWDRLLRELALVLPDDVWLTTLTANAGAAAGEGVLPPPGSEGAAAPTVSGGESTFTIAGYTRGQDGVARLLARLAVLPELSRVRLLSSTATTVGGESVVQFSISASVRTPGGAAA